MGLPPSFVGRHPFPGSISFSGQVGNNNSGLGISIDSANSALSTATGDISIKANAPAIGVLANSSLLGTISSTSGNITLTADTMAFGTPGSPTVSSSGWLLLQPTANSTAIGIGGGTLNLAPGLFSGANQVFKTGFNYIQIGNTSDTGGITVSAVTTVNDDLRLVEGSGPIAINSGLTLANPKTLLLQTTGGGTETDGSIIASGLQLLGSGANYVLGSTSNQITNLRLRQTSIISQNTTSQIQPILSPQSFQLTDMKLHCNLTSRSLS